LIELIELIEFFELTYKGYNSSDVPLCCHLIEDLAPVRAPIALLCPLANTHTIRHPISHIQNPQLSQQILAFKNENGYHQPLYTGIRKAVIVFSKKCILGIASNVHRVLEA
jgi:hypothetical protein